MSNNSENFFNGTKRGRGGVKHSILKYYLGAYFGCLGQTSYFDQLIYVDGFSGPGGYVAEDGTVEDGSPIVAIKVVIEHVHKNNFNKPIKMYFIEAKEEYANQLNHNINQIKRDKQIDENKFIIKIMNGQFDQLMNVILDEVEDTRCPMLVFADPFGIKSVPMDLMRRIVTRPVTELFLNVMFSSAIRWVNSPKYNDAFKIFLGEENSEWKTTVLKNNENKTESFIRYYVQKLTQDRRYHHVFGMKDQRNKHIYQLVYVTQYFKALIAMKRAMIKNSQESEKFVYSEFMEKHPINKLSDTQIRQIITQKIKEEFNGFEVYGRDIDRFVWEHTPFIFNLKKELKKDLEQFIAKKSGKFEEIFFKFAPSMEE